jgi:hypothetical protein
MDEIPGGFWRVVAEGLIHGQLNKPLFGRPYLKLGQCFGLWGYMMELGGILGAKHAAKLDAFVFAFLGMSGEAGAGRRFLVGTANKLLQRHSLGSMEFSDYVGADVADRLGYKGQDWSGLIMERGTQKFPPKVALTNAWEYASAGAGLGTIHPDVVRAMFERSHAPVPEEQWQQAFASGLDIGPEQPRTNYREAEQTENKNFMEYCLEFRPDLYSLLKDSS